MQDVVLCRRPVDPDIKLLIAQKNERDARKVRDVREQVEHGADAEAQRARDRERAHRVLDIVST